MRSYDTVTEALKDLKERGFNIDFNIATDRIICPEKKHSYGPKEFEIVEFYRFEGDSDPGDENTVFAIESTDGKVKGTMMTAFGTYTETISSDMLEKLSMHK